MLNQMDLKKMEAGIALLLKGMGVDVSGPDFAETPHRVAKLYKEMHTPKENNWKTFPAESADLVLLRNHVVHCLCPHHLLPVDIRCHIAYIPNELTVGLSKLARAVEEHITIPIMQETLASLVADSLEKNLKPKGVAVVLAGEHGCMRVRGVRSDGDIVTSVLRGVFLLNSNARTELMQLIGRP